VPIALHGGSGLSDHQFRDCISHGCAKVNISTALKETYMQSSLAFLRDAESKNKWDPPSLFTAVGDAARDMPRHYADVFGSSGKA
jgi:fructose-bisphosphate aldolase class II